MPRDDDNRNSLIALVAVRVIAVLVSGLFPTVESASTPLC